MRDVEWCTELKDNLFLKDCSHDDHSFMITCLQLLMMVGCGMANAISQVERGFDT